MTSTVKLGTWLTIDSEAIAEIVCKAGVDWVCVDLEHSSLSLAGAERLIRVADLCGVQALVRLSANDPVQIARVMDCGAHGIIVPMVKTGDDVTAALRAMHYPPLGRRGVGLSRAQGYGPGFDEYRQWLAESSVLIVQIEHQDALEHLDDIFEAGGMNAYMIGPYDLTASMGIAGQFAHPRYLEALKAIKEAGERAGIEAGIHVVEPDPEQLRARIDEGYTRVAYSVDFRIVDAAIRAVVDD